MKPFQLLAASAPMFFALIACSGAPSGAVESTSADDTLSDTSSSYVGDYVANGTETLKVASLNLESTGHFAATLKDSSTESGTWSVKAGTGENPDTLKLSVEGSEEQTFAIGHLLGAGYLVAGGVQLTQGETSENLSFAKAPAPPPAPTCTTLTCESGFVCDESTGTAKCVPVVAPSGGPTSLSGTYETDGTNTVKLPYNAYTFKSDGKYTAVGGCPQTGPGATCFAITTGSGTYKISDGEITFDDASDGKSTYFVTAFGNTLTLNATLDGSTAYFNKSGWKDEIPMGGVCQNNDGQSLGECADSGNFGCGISPGPGTDSVYLCTPLD